MSIHNKIEIVCIVVLVVGSESSRNWVRVVSGLGPIRLGSEKYQGSELSWVRVVRLPLKLSITTVLILVHKKFQEIIHFRLADPVPPLDPGCHFDTMCECEKHTN